MSKLEAETLQRITAIVGSVKHTLGGEAREAAFLAIAEIIEGHLRQAMLMHDTNPMRCALHEQLERLLDPHDCDSHIETLGQLTRTRLRALASEREHVDRILSDKVFCALTAGIAGLHVRRDNLTRLRAELEAEADKVEPGLT